MAMYLAGIPVPTIKLTGRWRSDVFIDYIHPQVEKFSTLVSKAMISDPSIFTIPNHNDCHHHHNRVSNHHEKHGLYQLIMIPNPIIV
jgi:hypothetical protein